MQESGPTAFDMEELEQCKHWSGYLFVHSCPFSQSIFWYGCGCYQWQQEDHQYDSCGKCIAPSELHTLELRPPLEIPEKMAAMINIQTTAKIIEDFNVFNLLCWRETSQSCMLNNRLSPCQILISTCASGSLKKILKLENWFNFMMYSESLARLPSALKVFISMITLFYTFIPLESPRKLSFKYNIKKQITNFSSSKGILNFSNVGQFWIWLPLWHVTRQRYKIIFCQSWVRTNQFLCLNEKFHF